MLLAMIQCSLVTQYCPANRLSVMDTRADAPAPLLHLNLILASVPRTLDPPTLPRIAAVSGLAQSPTCIMMLSKTSGTAASRAASCTMELARYRFMALSIASIPPHCARECEDMQYCWGMNRMHHGAGLVSLHGAEHRLNPTTLCKAGRVGHIRECVDTHTQIMQ